MNDLEMSDLEPQTHSGGRSMWRKREKTREAKVGVGEVEQTSVFSRGRIKPNNGRERERRGSWKKKLDWKARFARKKSGPKARSEPTSESSFVQTLQTE